MSTMKDNSVLPLAISAVAFVATSIYVLNEFKKKGSSKDDHVPVPMAPKSMVETLSLFSGKDTPFFMLEMVETCKSAIYRLNLPVPGGVYVIGDFQTRGYLPSLTQNDRQAQHFYASHIGSSLEGGSQGIGARIFVQGS